jgi:hypothetical protein
MGRKPINANKTAWTARVVHDRDKTEVCMEYPFLSDVGKCGRESG